MEYKVLIPTSGIGSRLGNLTKYTNKSLVRIGKKPTISYIIEKYPKDIEFVITLGYYGKHVKQFLTMAYPDRKFTFVHVDKFEGLGTSLGFSMLHAKEELQCPFIYNACDTITFDEIEPPSKDWIGGYQTSNLSQYDSYNIDNNHIITSMYEKGEIGSDFAYIGLIGVNSFNIFWRNLEELYNDNPNNTKLSDFVCINKIVNESSININHVEFKKWYDIGNVEALTHARESFNDKFHILDKEEESIYLFENSVIKFFHDVEINNNRVEKAKNMGNIVPKIIKSSENFYKYNYVEGELLADVVNIEMFNDLLNWTLKNLWEEIDTDVNFKKVCKDFYYNKTIKRLDTYFENRTEDKETIINGLEIPKIDDLLEQVDFKKLYNSKPIKFHGDFILDNIIKTDGFKLIDWRQDFGGHVELGDIYYDLAKLNHNLVINHSIINDDLYTIEKENNEIRLDIHRKNTLVECQEVLHKWIVDNGYDLYKVKLLTCIIWLNMAPLHHKPFDEFLFNFGKYNLYKIINNI